jgi:hypothetical protein
LQADQFKEVPTEEELKLGFKHGFAALVEHRNNLARKT